jgi:NAD(P)-dependent dehydrogenase (short-subunit alcohol dehydrogenase family)
MRLADEVAIVTGAASGIGKDETADALVRALGE